MGIQSGLSDLSQATDNYQCGLTQNVLSRVWGDLSVSSLASSGRLLRKQGESVNRIKILIGEGVDSYVRAELLSLNTDFVDKVNDVVIDLEGTVVCALSTVVFEGPMVGEKRLKNVPAVLVAKCMIADAPSSIDGVGSIEMAETLRRVSQSYMWIFPSISHQPNLFAAECWVTQGDRKINTNLQMKYKARSSLCRLMNVMLFFTPEQVESLRHK